MSDFRQVTDTFWASPQITLADVDEAAAHGMALIINNRPEGEAEDQVPGAEIARAAAAAGVEYRAIPVTHAGFSEQQVQEMREAIDGARGPVLAYCRSGTRSTLLWALAQAKAGGDPEAIATVTAGAGYDVAPIRPLIDMLAARGRS
jgi:uncharacterized protein (TIGR01244 family)